MGHRWSVIGLSLHQLHRPGQSLSRRAADNKRVYFVTSRARLFVVGILLELHGVSANNRAASRSLGC